ncbi:MAG TPA: IS1380 family transposase [Terriglobales bacterium]|nr:IS1380 family transposase [Terriglobales bacterium]
MNEHTTTECLLFPDIFDRPVVAKFDEQQGSSDGGAVLLKAADRRLALTEALAACLQDNRQPGKVRHELQELLTQRIMAIACGYEDANDAARLASDPVHKLLVGRDPVEDEDLASQPTLSRFENTPDRKELFRMAEALADSVIERHRKRLHGRARRITIDLDPTDDPSHGQQQFTFFNTHYDCYCYLPVVAFLTFDKEPDQYLVAAVLRPGNVSGSCGAVGILRRLLARLREAFPKATFRVRLDGGFAAPEVLAFLDDQPHLEYVVNMASNKVLDRLVEPAMRKARGLSKQSGETEHIYGEFRYKTQKSWKYKRRIIYKAEVTRHPNRDPKDNPRFVVTNMKQNPQWLYKDIYCQRGDIENRIKELHYGMEIGRTSCSDFWANQFRVLMTAAAYILMQELRLRLARTNSARAQVSTLRERFLKIGVQVVTSVRRIVLHLPQAFPFRDTFSRLALSLGAQTG